VDFAFSDQQEELRQQARTLLASANCTATLRDYADADKPAFDADLWQQICAPKWSGIALPQAFGGDGKTSLELCVLAEEIGYALAPVPLIGSAFIVAMMIDRFGRADQRAKYLPDLISGRSIACLVPNLRHSLSVTDGKLSGVATVVADAPIANLALAVVKDTDQSPPCPAIYLVDLTSAEVISRAQSSIDLSQPLGEFTFNAATAELLVSGEQAIAELADRTAILTAFNQLGSAQRCLDLATAYAKQRFQFGRAIGSFQAMKQKLATLLVEIELARANCYYGAWALNNVSESAPEQLTSAASLAWISATQAFKLAAQECVHVHGGRGFTWNEDPQLFLRRSRAVEAQLGGVSTWQEKLLKMTLEA